MTTNVKEAIEGVVVNAADGTFVFVVAALPLIAMHYFNLQHCLNTPGPPFPFLSLQ